MSPTQILLRVSSSVTGKERIFKLKPGSSNYPRLYFLQPTPDGTVDVTTAQFYWRDPILGYLYVYDVPVFIEAREENLSILPHGWKPYRPSTWNKIRLAPSTPDRQMVVRLRHLDTFIAQNDRFVLEYLDANDDPLEDSLDSQARVVNLQGQSQPSMGGHDIEGSEGISENGYDTEGSEAKSGDGHNIKGIEATSKDGYESMDSPEPAQHSPLRPIKVEDEESYRPTSPINDNRDTSLHDNSPSRRIMMHENLEGFERLKRLKAIGFYESDDLISSTAHAHPSPHSKTSRIDDEEPKIVLNPNNLQSNMADAHPTTDREDVHVADSEKESILESHGSANDTDHAHPSSHNRELHLVDPELDSASDAETEGEQVLNVDEAYEIFPIDTGITVTEIHLDPGLPRIDGSSDEIRPNENTSETPELDNFENSPRDEVMTDEVADPLATGTKSFKGKQYSIKREKVLAPSAGTKKRILSSYENDSSETADEGSIVVSTELINIHAVDPSKKRRTSSMSQDLETPPVKARAAATSMGSSKSSRRQNVTTPTPSSSLRSSRTSTAGAAYAGPPPNIVFSSSTTINKRAAPMKFLKGHGGSEVEEMSDCTMLCIGKGELKKTAKLILAVITGKDVVIDSWLTESMKEGKFLDAAGYMPVDKKHEEEWKMKLADAIQRGKDGFKPLEGFKVFFSTTLKSNGAAIELKEIALAAGAKWCSKAPSKVTDKLIVLVADDEDKDIQNLLHKGFHVYRKELLTLGLLREETDLADNGEFGLCATEE